MSRGSTAASIIGRSESLSVSCYSKFTETNWSVVGLGPLRLGPFQYQCMARRVIARLEKGKVLRADKYLQIISCITILIQTSHLIELWSNLVVLTDRQITDRWMKDAQSVDSRHYIRGQILRDKPSTESNNAIEDAYFLPLFKARSLLYLM